MKIYDSIIIGGGIAGVSIAFELQNRGKKVLIIDKDGIARGGSGSAGAFISPKIGLASPLHTLTNQAFDYAKDFYIKHTKEHFYQSGVIRLAKDEVDSFKFKEYENINYYEYKNLSSSELKSYNIKPNLNAFLFPTAGDCDAVEVCKTLSINIDKIIADIKEIKREDDMWIVDKYKAKNLILATGYESNLIDIRYMGIRGLWGERGDYISSKEITYSIHQSLSIGASRDNITKIGATHNREIKEITTPNIQKLKELEIKAYELFDTNLKLKKAYGGMRAVSKDSYPLVGKVVDIEFMLTNHPNIKKGNLAPLKYIDNLFVLNGMGGRGFVFAPLMAKKLSQLIIDKKEIEKIISPDRLFFKWVRRF